MRRLAVLLALALVAAAVAVSSAHAALFFLFEPATAKAGGVARVRLGGTPAEFRARDRQPPLREPVRVYLVPHGVAGEVRSRFDSRLHFIGRIIPDRNSRGVLNFHVPPLDTGLYDVAYWCRACAQYSRGVSFGVQTVPRVSRYRRWMGLRVRLPNAQRSCPVTRGEVGNGFLSTTLPADGVLSRPRQSDGSLFDKLGWLPRKGFTGTLKVRGEQLDGDGELRVLSVNWGYATAPGRDPVGSWRTAVEFPDEGCWRLTGRVGDVALSYVVRVVAAP